MKKKKKNKVTKPYGITRVHWLDHNSVDGWHKLKDIKKAGLEVHSVGFLVWENDDVICLAQSVTAWQEGDILTIVKACVIDRWDLTE